MGTHRGVAATMVLLLGTVGCGGAGTSTGSTTTDSRQAGPKITLDACPGTVPGLFAVDHGGTLRWSRCDENGNYSLMPVTIADGLVYIIEPSGGEPSLVALNADAGTEVWRFGFSYLNEGWGYEAVRASDKASFAASGVIVLDVESGTGVDHVGLDSKSGHELWRVPDDGGLVTLNTEELVVTAVGFGGDLAGTGPTTRVAAYDRRTGERRWVAEEVPYFGSSTGARLAGHTMVVQSYANAAPAGVMGIDLGTGTELWRHDDLFWLVSASADVVVGLAGRVDSPTSAELIALDPDDGSELWHASAAFPTSFADKTAMQAWTNTLLIDGTVVAQTGEVLVGLDPRSGEMRWRRNTDFTGLAGGGGQILLSKMQSGLELVSIEDGAVRWTTSFAAAMDVGSAVTDDLTVLSLVRIPVPTSAPTGPSPTYADPAAGSVGCKDGTVLSGAFIAPIGPGEPTFGLTVLISADESSFCVTNSSGTEDVVPFQPGRVVDKAEAQLVLGAIADYLVVAVPSIWGQNPEVRTGQSQQLASAITPDGATMLVIDYAPVGASPDMYVDRTFTFTDSERQTLDQVTLAAPPTGSIEDVLACLGQRGIHVAPLGTPDTNQLDKQPMDPSLTNSAWSACRPLVLLWFTSSGQNLPQAGLDSMDCMATKGFIEMFTAGEIDEAARGAAMAECNAAQPLGDSGLRCDIHTIDSNGTVSAEPILTDLLGFGADAQATAPATATIGERVTVTIPALTARLIDSALSYEVVEHRDSVRTFGITGATIVPGSLVLDPAAGIGASATATETTVTLGWATPVAGGAEVTFPEAKFDIVANAPAEVTVIFASNDSTMRVRDSDGVETQVRALCTTDDRVLTTIAVS